MRKLLGLILILSLLNTNCALVVNKKQFHANTAIQFSPKEELKKGNSPEIAIMPEEPSPETSRISHQDHCKSILSLTAFWPYHSFIYCKRRWKNKTEHHYLSVTMYAKH